MEHFNAFIDDLRSSHGKNLVSVVLYGSAAAGDYVPRRSDHNILVVLEKIGPDDLRLAHAASREWNRIGNPTPVYFTASEIQNAGDVFPIEFHQMKTARKVLYGPDLLAGIEISGSFLRLQTEFELRSKLIRLRRRYIAVSTSPDALVSLMVESISSFAALFRAVLILNGIDPPATKHEIVALTSKHIGINNEPFEKIFDIRENKSSEAIDESSANRLFGEYITQIEGVIDAVDRLEK